MRDVHRAAAQGFANAADSYVRGRPEYPDAIQSWLRDSIHLGSGSTVVDLGAGTGKFTPQLVATGATVIAIEPVDEMRAKLAGALPAVRVLKGTATEIPLEDATVDAVLCAQAFHWFATREALAEIHRVLRPGGRLGLVWNVRDERVTWVRELGAIVNAAQSDAPRYSSGAWRSVFPYPGFGPMHEQYFALRHVGTSEDVIMNRVRSTSFIAAMTAGDRAHLEKQVQRLIESTPELRGKSEVAVPTKPQRTIS